jgi:hypothetical protein
MRSIIRDRASYKFVKGRIQSTQVNSSFQDDSTDTGYEFSSLSGRSHGAILNRRKLMAEIRRIARLKAPLKDKMNEIRHLIDQYFKFNGNEESLNANLP